MKVRHKGDKNAPAIVVVDEGIKFYFGYYEIGGNEAELQAFRKDFFTPLPEWSDVTEDCTFSGDELYLERDKEGRIFPCYGIGSMNKEFRLRKLPVQALTSDSWVFIVERKEP